MESTTLASGEDAGLILKLYELRREPTMRAARHWLSAQFWPQTAEEVFLVQNEFGSQHNQYLRQVLTYWEMAASFVLRGALDADLFLECNSENIFLLAKFRPLLNEIRVVAPLTDSSVTPRDWKSVDCEPRARLLLPFLLLFETLG